MQSPPINYHFKNVKLCSLVISAYPLSREFIQTVISFAGIDAQFETVASLRGLGSKALIRLALARPRAAIYIASESEKARALEPALTILALGFRMPPIRFISPSGDCRSSSFIRTSGCVLKLVIASLKCIAARIGVGFMTGSQSKNPVIIPPSLKEHCWTNSRILYIKNTMSFGVRAGGSVGHVAGVVNALHDAGAKITLITNEPAPMIRSGICEAHPQGLGTFGLPSQANIFRMQSSTVLLGIQEANRHKPDFIYQRLTLGDCSGAILSHRLGVPLIVEYNGSEIWCNKNWGAGVRYAKEFARAEEAMLRSAAVVFTISQVLYNELLSRGLPPNRVGWYPNGIDPNVFNPKLFPENIVVATRRLLGFSNDEFVMTFVGTFGDWHGADVFARSAVEICSREGGNHGKGLRFLFIGDGKNRARCEAIVRDNFAKERCTFLGLIPQEQTPQYLAVSDCFVSPHVPNPDGTEFFGSPTKLFEYMAMGKSIIASKLGQIGDVLEDGKTGIVVKPGDVKELSAGLQLLHADPVLREKLGATARQTALKLYTWGAHIEALRKCIV